MLHALLGLVDGLEEVSDFLYTKVVFLFHSCDHFVLQHLRHLRLKLVKGDLVGLEHCILLAIFMLLLDHMND